jgi:hypothetical protein
MYDINFFSVYKKKKAKNNGFKIFAIVFLGLFVLGNIIVIGAGLLVFSGLEASIKEKEAFINSAETKDKITEAARIKQEATLTNDYLALLKSSAAKLKQIDNLNTALLDKVRSLTPATTSFTVANYKENRINLECLSTLITDPMDMYHAFLGDPTFATVTLSGIDYSGSAVQFNISCQLAGGVNK